MSYDYRIDAVLELGMYPVWQRCNYEVVRNGQKWLISVKQRMTQFRN